MSGAAWTVWTIRFALLGYFLVVASWVAGARGTGIGRNLRWIWCLACAAFLAHLALAFHVHHGWSHQRAYAHTAAETDRLLGIPFGAGIYFNHLFALVWVADCVWWLAAPASYLLRRLAGALIQGYLAFIVLNGAIVFEDGPVRWSAIACLLALGGVAAWRGRRREGEARSEEGPPQSLFG